MALFAWAAMAQHYGFAAADDDESYSVKGHAETHGHAGVYQLDMLHATPNGGKRDMRTALTLKATGVKAGYPDISLDVARHKYHGLRIELKRPGGEERAKGTVSDEQRRWILRLTRECYKAVVCVGWEQARDEIKNYLT